MSGAFMQSNLSGIKVRRGKVRDMHNLNEHQLMVTTDRISAFDHVLPSGIPDKGRVLTQMTLFWIKKLNLSYPLVANDLKKIQQKIPTLRFVGNHENFDGRTLLVRTGKVIPIECIVRGYLSGSGWKEYQKNQSVCGIKLPKGLQESEKLPEPIFTPATKEEEGHDINVTQEFIEKEIGEDVATKLKETSIALYLKASEYAESRGIIIADTKFEFGFAGDLRGGDGSGALQGGHPIRRP